MSSSRIVRGYSHLKSHICAAVLWSRPMTARPNRAQTSDVIVFIRSAISAQRTHSAYEVPKACTSITVCGERAPRLTPPVSSAFSHVPSSPALDKSSIPQPGPRLSHPVPGTSTTSTAIWRNESGRSDDGLNCPVTQHAASTESATAGRAGRGQAMSQAILVPRPMLVQRVGSEPG